MLQGCAVKANKNEELMELCCYSVCNPVLEVFPHFPVNFCLLHCISVTLLFETPPHYVLQEGHKHTIPLPQITEFWDHKHVPLCSVRPFIILTIWLWTFPVLLVYFVFFLSFCWSIIVRQVRDNLEKVLFWRLQDGACRCQGYCDHTDKKNKPEEDVV